MRTLSILLLTLLLSISAVAEPFTFATPERTWATFKFALDTSDFALFQSCMSETTRGEFSPNAFKKFLTGDGRFAQTSRVVGVEVDGEKATLSIDFYCRESDGRLLVDNDPVHLVQVDGRWLLDGL